jgi:hypothetical protein
MSALSRIFKTEREIIPQQSNGVALLTIDEWMRAEPEQRRTVEFRRPLIATDVSVIECQIYGFFGSVSVYARGKAEQSGDAFTEAVRQFELTQPRSAA